VSFDPNLPAHRLRVNYYFRTLLIFETLRIWSASDALGVALQFGFVSTKKHVPLNYKTNGEELRMGTRYPCKYLF